MRASKTASRTVKRANSLLHDRRGNVAIIFAIVLVPVMVLIGLAVDTARALHVGNTAQNALDAAALAAAQALTRENLDEEGVIKVATDSFKANAGDKVDFASFGPLAVEQNSETGEVTVSVDTQVPTTLGALAHVDQISLRRSSTALMGMSDIELGLMLDVTGSMRGSKLRALKNASNDLFDALMPDGSNNGRVRIGLAPYSAAVNAGRYADRVSDGTSRDGCVVNRLGREIDGDAAPRGSEFFRSIEEANATLERDSGRRGYDFYQCPDAEVLPLTDDKERLRHTVNGYRADGRTAGHLGIAWSWYLLSPDWRSVWGAANTAKPYGSEDLIKAVVLMTDGEFNAAYADSDRQRDTTRESFRRAENLCDNIKRENIIVFSVAFDLNDRDAERALSDCASSSNYFFRAENEEELRRAYRNIAIKLTELRISK